MSKKQKPVAEPMRMVLVEWLDAYTQDAGWKSVKKLRKQEPVLVRTIGWLVKDVPDHITVAGSHVPFDDDCDGDVVIVRGMIKSIKTLAVAE